MSNFFQVLEMMAVPAAFFLFCRYLNVRNNRTPLVPDRSLDAQRHEPAVGSDYAGSGSRDSRSERAPVVRPSAGDAA